LSHDGRQPLNPAFVRLEQEALDGFFSNFNRPMLGVCDEALQKTFFPKFSGTLNSVAISPLIVQDRLIGTLNQGSCTSNRFSVSAPTDMLEHLTAVTAVTVDNVLVHERLREDGLTDPLTGLSNRRFFERRLKEEVKRWFRNKTDLSCMLVDIDFFKSVNDRFGHQVGDSVLKTISNELGSDLRASDVLARYGGEEFVLLLPETDASHAVEIAERLRERIENNSDWGISITITISVGVATLTQSGVSQSQACNWLVRQADTALYKAKHRGRNCVIQAEGKN
jgi:two-component system cell cycle response regulator